MATKTICDFCKDEIKDRIAPSLSVKIIFVDKSDNESAYGLFDICNDCRAVIMSPHHKLMWEAIS